MGDLYNKILEGLADLRVSSRTFERCVCDLLRETFPGIVPVGGSGDFGMDGAIADDEGEPYPLVCTMDLDVIGNLTHNLDRYVATGGRSRKVVIVTSQQLTPPRRKNLEDRAREKGFEPKQVFGRESLASLLCRDSQVRLDLLGIHGDPPALTAVPRRRPSIEIPPLGRDGDIHWLESTDEDRVLAGQPGSGKTYLIYHLINRLKWDALFMDVESGRGEIADALRYRQPKVVVMDDAHLWPEALERLIRVRVQIEARFSIVATTWPSGTKRVIAALGGGVPVRNLELLTRREIQTVIEQVGVNAPDSVMRHLIDQSANRPGLAVTLAQLMLQGHYEEVLDGSALRDALFARFERTSKALQLLAALGLGGDRGMSLADAGEYLGIPRGDAKALAYELSDVGDFGVLTDLEKNLPDMLRSAGEPTLSVWPRPLRWQVVKSFFFESPRQVYRPVLAKVPSRADAISTLLLAKAQCGASINGRELGELVRSEDSLELWQLLAQVGEDEARWALENYPGDVLQIARQALETTPSASLDRVLTRAAEMTSEERPRPDPWAVLGEWVKDLSRAEQGLERREQLARAAATFLPRDPSVGAAALFVALDPGLQDVSLDPAEGRVLTLGWGLLSERELEALLELWRRVRPKLTTVGGIAWTQAERTLWTWVHPDAGARGAVPDETMRFMREVAAEILRDLAPLVAHSPGIGTRLEDLARRCGVELELDIDPAFRLVYPDFGELGPNRREAVDARLESIRRLAREWRRRPASEVAAQLAAFEAEADLASTERLSDQLARELAREVADPAAWFEAFLDRGLQALATAFTEQIVSVRRPRWEEHLGRCFELAQPLRFLAAELILQMPEPPRELLERAMKVAEEIPWLVETLALRRLLPIPLLRLFLRHPRRLVALAAAVGECNSRGGGGAYSARVRAEIRADWWEAILRAKGADYQGEDLAALRSWLPAILASDPQLAFEWLERRLSERDFPAWLQENGAFARAARALDSPHRAQLLARLQDSPIAGGLAGWLAPSAG